MYRQLGLHTGKALFLFLCLTLVPLMAERVHAHAVVTESSLASEPIRPHKPTTVVLMFNSNVELKLSRIFLVSAGDVYRPLQAEKGKKPGEVRIQMPALEPGEYALKYKVFAADGHFTENAIRFNVAETK